MKLVFRSKYLSLDQFDPVDLPDFTVLTGVNGAGKSHLLGAIQAKSVLVDGIGNAQVVLFNYETFRLDNEAEFNTNQLIAERTSLWQFYESHIKGRCAAWRQALGATYSDIKAQCLKENKSLWNLRSDPAQQYRVHVSKLFEQLIGNQNNEHARRLYSLARSLPYSIDELAKSDLDVIYRPFAFKHDFLPYHLGKVFWDYYVKHTKNQFNAFRRLTYGTHGDAIPDAQFVALHGKKPWDIVNDILMSFDTLKYRVTTPEGSDLFDNFQMKLQHIEQPELTIDFSGLSSGERVLMALVASVYKASADKQFPDLLLLDEIDASLHPSMMKTMLQVIERVFLSEGVKVVLVTHSPTTIALAPETSVYVMERSGFDRIKKKTRQDALSILTQGFATIDEGLKLFDEVARADLTIITEGRNTRLIEKALQLHNITGVHVLRGVEDKSGSTQLKTIFEFFARVPHDKKVIFVWDCDVTFGVTPGNNTYPFVIPKNAHNTIAKSGIENAFPVDLFDGYTKITTLSDGVSITEFDSRRKRDFEQRVLERSRAEDFLHLEALVREVRRIQALSRQL